VEPTVIEIGEVDSPIGGVMAAVGDGRVSALCFADGWPRQQADLERRFGAIEWRPAADPAGVLTRLTAYFAGDLGALDPIAVDPGGTPFQQAVWQALRAIRPGETRSYGELARAIGQPHASRAVGAANGSNPVSLILPCHRVIGSDGRLVGYGGGLDRKRWLLRHEGVILL
jgi:methylated-DNA-[protein]-cysteine S-methyltransferase